MSPPAPDPRARPSQDAALEGPWRRRPEVGWRASLEGLVLLPPGGGDPVTVAGSATAVWDLLAAPTTRADLAARLARTYDADPDVVAADLGPLLARLDELGAIQRVSSDFS